MTPSLDSERLAVLVHEVRLVAIDDQLPTRHVAVAEAELDGDA